MEKIRILIVDHQEVVLTGVTCALSSHEEFEVIGTAKTGREALQKAKDLKPDVVIMDVNMPDIDGVEATLEIKKMNPKVRVIIFTMYSDAECLLDLLRADISGYILKEDTMADLIRAVQASAEKRMFFSNSSGQILFHCMDGISKIKETEGRLNLLSRREREILRLMGDGLLVRQIAERLSISPKTVETHKYNIMDKLGVSRSPDLVKIAVREKLGRP